MPTVVLYAGNPRFVRTELANQYYAEIVEFLESLGCDVHITQSPGEIAEGGTVHIGDIVVAHGKQVDRLINLTEQPQVIIKLGHPEGIIHPKDLAWQNAGCTGIPPVEHFIFTADQKIALEEAVKALPVAAPAMPDRPRQSASRRPGVR